MLKVSDIFVLGAGRNYTALSQGQSVQDMTVAELQAEFKYLSQAAVATQLRRRELANEIAGRSEVSNELRGKTPEEIARLRRELDKI